ncbi:MAG: NUDIX domain-containing protein [bacterium]|nr:NUDIX domain-containing protein [bacterium]
MEYKKKIINQSGVVPYFMDNDAVRFVLITSSKGSWIFPKGLIDEGFSAQEAAAQEALEEAGVTGEVSQAAVGFYEYKKWGGTCKVEMFLLKVHTILDEWDERPYRKRSTCSFEEAAAMIQPRLQDILSRANKEILSQIQKQDVDKNLG